MKKNYKKALFLRIPKTASTSVISLFKKTRKLYEAQNFFKSRQNAILYFDTRYYLNVMKRSQKWFDLKQNNIFTFGFVRNPWDRAVSSWKFGSHGKDWNLNFVDFCRNLKNLKINPKNGKAKNALLFHICEQHPFLICENKNLKADFIGRFENLQEDFNIICNKIGIQQQLPHKNKNKHKHYSEYYDDETRELVAEKYKKDIEYFGYKFGE
jgi:hypothetical protein